MIGQQRVCWLGTEDGSDCCVCWYNLMHFPQCNSLTFSVMYEEKKNVWGLYVYAVLPTGEFKQAVVMREREKKELGEWRTSPWRVPLKIGSKLPIPALLVSTKLCLCSPFQGTPGVLASIWCA